MKNLPGFAGVTALYIIIGILVIGGGAYVAVHPEVVSAPADEPEQEADVMDTAVKGEGNTSAGALGKVTINWKFDALGEDATGMARTKVTAVINGIAHEIGTYNGTCSEVGAEGGVDGKGLLVSQGEVSAAQCWWAGGGDEIGLFKTDSGLQVKVGALDEGTAESSGVRGNFVTKLDLTLMQ